MLSAFTLGFVIGAIAAATPSWWRRRQIRAAVEVARRERDNWTLDSDAALRVLRSDKVTYYR